MVHHSSKNDGDRKSTIDATGAQIDKLRVQNAAGEDIIIGANPDELLRFVKEYIWRDVQESDIEKDRMRQELRTARLELWLWRILCIGIVVIILIRVL